MNLKISTLKIYFFFILLPTFSLKSFATIDIPEIAGLYDIFKADYKHLSPVYGLILLKSGVLKNIRFHGLYGEENNDYLCHKSVTHPPRNFPSRKNVDCPQDSTTAIIQHIFPSPTGNLSVVASKSDLFGTMAIKDIGKLLHQYVDNKDILKFFASYSTSPIRNGIGKDWSNILNAKSSKDSFLLLAQRYANLFDMSRKEVENYPPHIIEHTLLALAAHQAKSADDLLPLLEELKPFLEENWQDILVQSRGKFSPKTYQNFKEESIDEYSKFYSEKAVDNLLLNDENFVFNTLGFDQYDNLFPRMLEHETIKLNDEGFTDCGETSIRNLFNALFPANNRSFDTETLKKMFPHMSNELLDFYKNQQNSFDQITDDTKTRVHFAAIVSGQNDSDIIYEKNRCEIKGAGIDNVLAVIKNLLQDDDLNKIWINNFDDKISRRKEILNYLFDRFSRPDLKLDWENADSNDKEINNNFVNLNITVNGEPYFLWESIEGHYSFLPLPTKKNNDWRKNDQRLILTLLENPRELYGALLPFLINDKNSRIFYRNNMPPFFANYVLYSGYLDNDGKLQALNSTASLKSYNETLRKKWFKELNDQVVKNKIGATIYNFHRAGNDDALLFFKDVFENISSLISYLQAQVNDPNSLSFSYAEPFLIDYINTLEREEDLQKNAVIIFKLATHIDIFNDLGIVKYFLKNSPTIFTYQDSDGRTLFHKAIERKSNEVINLILTNDEVIKKIVFIKDNKGNTPLHTASEKGNISLARYLAKNFPQLLSDINLVKNDTGMSPLHIAAVRKQNDMVVVLLEIAPQLASDENLAKNKFGVTPLSSAITMRNKDLVSILIYYAPALLSMSNSRQQSPLRFALTNLSTHKEIAKLIAEAMTIEALQEERDKLGDNEEEARKILDSVIAEKRQ